MPRSKTTSPTDPTNPTNPPTRMQSQLIPWTLIQRTLAHSGLGRVRKSGRASFPIGAYSLDWQMAGWGRGWIQVGEAG